MSFYATICIPTNQREGNMKYPFDLMEIGAQKSRLFTDERAMLNARTAVYKIQSKTLKRFAITIDGLRLTVQRVKDRSVPAMSRVTSYDPDYSNPNVDVYAPLHKLRRNETMRITILRDSHRRNFIRAVENIAETNRWQITFRFTTDLLEIYRADVDYYDYVRSKARVKKTCQGRYRAKYPYKKMAIDACLRIPCATREQQDRARQAAYALASRKRWGFDTERVAGCHDLKVWRIK
jgi:hypothetical protein